MACHDPLIRPVIEVGIRDRVVEANPMVVMERRKLDPWERDLAEGSNDSNRFPPSGRKPSLGECRRVPK